MKASATGPDAVLEALDRIVGVMTDAAPRQRLADRTREVRELRASGLAYHEIADRSLRPAALDLVDGYIEALSNGATQLRRALVATLRDEGLTMLEIAELLGVTRQRVSQILHANGD